MSSIYSVLIVEINFFYLYLSILISTVLPIGILYLLHREAPFKKLVLYYLNYGVLIFILTFMFWMIYLSRDNYYATMFTRPLPGSNLKMD